MLTFSDVTYSGVQAEIITPLFLSMSVTLNQPLYPAQGASVGKHKSLGRCLVYARGDAYGISGSDWGNNFTLVSNCQYLHALQEKDIIMFILLCLRMLDSDWLGGGH